MQYWIQHKPHKVPIGMIHNCDTSVYMCMDFGFVLRLSNIHKEKKKKEKQNGDDCAIKICQGVTFMSIHSAAHSFRHAHDMQEKIDQKISQILDVKILCRRISAIFTVGT